MNRSPKLHRFAASEMPPAARSAPNESQDARSSECYGLVAIGCASALWLIAVGSLTFLLWQTLTAQGLATGTVKLALVIETLLLGLLPPLLFYRAVQAKRQELNAVDQTHTPDGRFQS